MDMEKKNLIPLSVMDEHNDAYAHWFRFIEKGFIPPQGNALLHVDHHDDIECGGYRSDLKNPPGSYDEALRIVDESLGIADFIVPAIWQRVFDSVHILKELIPTPVKTEEEFIRYTESEDGSMLVRGSYIPFIHSPLKKNGAEDYAFYTMKTGGLNPGDDMSVENLVLDVDLDYFSWDDTLSTVPQKRIEITEEAFRDYSEDRNHPFRILPKKLIFPVESCGRYYLEYRETGPEYKPVSRERIDKRIDRLFNWFEKTGVTPAAIDVCRSSYSGYLPADTAAYTEDAFFGRLSSFCEVERID